MDEHIVYVASFASFVTGFYFSLFLDYLNLYKRINKKFKQVRKLTTKEINQILEYLSNEENEKEV